MNTVQDFNFTPKAKRALDVAKQRCVENNQLEINDEFLLLSVLSSESMIVNLVFESLPIDVEEVISSLKKDLPSCKKKISVNSIKFDQEVIKIINQSFKISQSFKQNYTGIEHLFLSLLRHSDSTQKFFKKNEIDIAFIADKVEKECKMIANPAKKTMERPVGAGSQQKESSSLSSDYNEMAIEGKFDNIFFRDNNKVSDCKNCTKRNKNMPFLVFLKL